jgi:hypothetical protein
MPRPTERQALDRTIGVLHLREKGLSLRAIAIELHTTENALKAFTRRGVFRTMAKFLGAQESAPDARMQADRQRDERRRWNERTSDALAYFEAAFEKDVHGKYVDAGRAERAAKLVAESQGWTEPEAPAPKPQTLKLGVIQAAMAAIAASDRGETVVRVQLDVATRHDAERPLAVPASG